MAVSCWMGKHGALCSHYRPSKAVRCFQRITDQPGVQFFLGHQLHANRTCDHIPYQPFFQLEPIIVPTGMRSLYSIELFIRLKYPSTEKLYCLCCSGINKDHAVNCVGIHRPDNNTGNGYPKLSVELADIRIGKQMRISS